MSPPGARWCSPQVVICRLLGVLSLVGTGCNIDEVARASIAATNGGSLVGDAVFQQVGSTDQVNFEITLDGAGAGAHAVTLHEGDCDAADPSAVAEHWNPEHLAHGAPSDAVHHLGDIDNIVIDSDGSGTLQFVANEWKVQKKSATTNVIGRIIVVHARVDDFITQPDGGAGAAIGCGRIEYSD